MGERLTVTWKGLPQTRGVGNANVSVQTPGWILRGTALSRHRVRGGARPHPLPVGEARERGVRLSGAAGFFLAWPSWMLHRCRPVLTRRFVSRAAGRRSNPGAFPQVAETEPPVQCLAVPRQCPPVSGSVRQCPVAGIGPALRKPAFGLLARPAIQALNGFRQRLEDFDGGAIQVGDEIVFRWSWWRCQAAWVAGAVDGGGDQGG